MPITRKGILPIGLAIVAVVVAGTASAQQIRNAISDVARPLPLSAVRLTGGPLKRAQDLNTEYLLRLEPDRMMAYYRKRAGLEPKAQGYGGWDGDGRNLTGHIGGHYLSAVSLMYAATGDTRFKERADYIVNKMKEVQDKHGDGYLGALEGGREKFNEVAQGNISLKFLRPQRSLVSVVRFAQDIRRAARRLSLHRQPHRAGTGDQIRRMGGRDPFQTGRRADSEDAQHWSLVA